MAGWLDSHLARRRDGVKHPVEDRRIRCTRFDAFRFFAEPARPLDVVAPTRERQSDMEQLGCLHANMDLCHELGDYPAVASCRP
jgi:hypothetical protein